MQIGGNLKMDVIKVRDIPEYLIDDPDGDLSSAYRESMSNLGTF